MKQKDIMLIMSDQHSQKMTGFEERRIDTPHLKRIAKEGLRFDRCYCNAPLCVPSRMSFLTGQLPSELEIFNNESSLSSHVPTIAHEMGSKGYYTVLIGRMHFKGDEQKHGFARRLCGDITSQYWGTGGKHRKDFEEYAGKTNRLHCLEAVGGGVSPVMYYDDMVWKETITFLEDWGKQEGEKPPLFLVVGFYGPHFPFVCEETLYRKYQSRFTPEECSKEAAEPALPFYEEYCQEIPPERMRNCRAAYCGLVEQLDYYVGNLHDCFLDMVRGKEHLFCYTSDHGEQLGYRNIYGKQTLYEDAVKVPLILKGTGICAGAVHKTISLLDVSKLLLSEENVNQTSQENRWVRIQQILTWKGRKVLAEAAVYGRYKILRVDGGWYVYQLKDDPGERQNLMEHNRTEAERLISLAKENKCFLKEEQVIQLIKREYHLCEMQKHLKVWGEKTQPQEWATVQIPPGVLRSPVE